MEEETISSLCAGAVAALAIFQCQESKRINGVMPVGYLRSSSLRKKQCDMTPESQKRQPLLVNDLVNTLPSQQIQQ
jgi:hypothetical protein